jgi:hypothetical protein
MVNCKLNHAYFQIEGQYSGEVEVVHEVGPNSGQHWAEEGRCWCHPKTVFDFVPGLPHKVRIVFHVPFKPNWGS